MKKWVLSLIFLCLFMAHQLQAKSRTPACEDKEPAILREVAVTGLPPNYFAKAFAKKDWVSYTTSSGDNKILDLQTNIAITIPGAIDPVPFINEELLVTPLTKGLGIYQVDELFKEGVNSKPLLTDVDMDGIYQSVGILKKNNSTETYRILTDEKGITIRDYTVDLSVPEVSNKIKPLGLPLQPCMGKDLKLPMLSKDGLELAALDMKTNTMKVFALPSCREVLDLGFKTGKIDFSFDGNWLAFHRSENSVDLDDDNFGVPEKMWNLQIYAYNRSSKEIVPLTLDLQRNSYYPVFKENGQIIFLRQNKNNNSYAIATAEIKPSPLPWCKSKSVTAEPADENAAYASLVQRKCAVCHALGNLKIDFLDVTGLRQRKAVLTPSLSLVEAMQKRTMGADGLERMPKGGSLAPTEQAIILNWLSRQ